MSYKESGVSMQYTSIKKKTGRELIAQSSAKVMGHEVSYRLYQLKKSGAVVYQIYSGYRRDRVYCFAGGDRALAEDIFSAVVRGRVTPCTLTFIIRDLLPDCEAEEVAGIS